MKPDFSQYESLFGRNIDYVREPQPEVLPAIRVLRIPAVKVSWLRRFSTPVHDRTVYVTQGMSQRSMNIPAEDAQRYPARIELITYSLGVYVGAQDGQDLVSAHLQALAAMPFQNDMFFGPLQTASVQEPICPGTDMNAFFFAVPDGIDMGKLCSCTAAAELVVSVMPITSAEHSFAVKNGSLALLELFEKKKVPNLFDVKRASAA